MTRCGQHPNRAGHSSLQQGFARPRWVLRMPGRAGYEPCFQELPQGSLGPDLAGQTRRQAVSLLECMQQTVGSDLASWLGARVWLQDQGICLSGSGTSQRLRQEISHIQEEPEQSPAEAGVQRWSPAPVWGLLSACSFLLFREEPEVERKPLRISHTKP